MTTSSPPDLHIFISHSNKDDDFGKKLVKDLKDEFGKDAVWYDSRGGLHGGDQWWPEILNELKKCNVFIVVLSPDAMVSQYVNDEITIAWRRRNSPNGIHVIPVLYRQCEVRDDLNTLQIVSFLEPETYKKGLKKLLKSLELLSERQTPGIGAPPSYRVEPVVKSLPLVDLPPRSPQLQQLLDVEPDIHVPRVPQETLFKPFLTMKTIVMSLYKVIYDLTLTKRIIYTIIGLVGIFIGIVSILSVLMTYLHISPNDSNNPVINITVWSWLIISGVYIALMWWKFFS